MAIFFNGFVNFLNFENKRILVAGVANRKSIAWVVASKLKSAGANVIFSIRSKARLEALGSLMDGEEVYICDVEREEDILKLGEDIRRSGEKIDGFFHSIAFANYSAGMGKFHDTSRKDFLQAMIISCFSLVEMSRLLKPMFSEEASVVTMGISSQVTAESYGYMAPIKAALDSSVRFLAKSFSADTKVRFNCVKAGPLKTSASAGIPGYIDNYLYAEKMTFRKKAVRTDEVANVVLFLLSHSSSGINGQGIVVNAGMDINYFDRKLINAVVNASND
ncbi:MAG: SDR family oxidoreductase [Puniceicoccales bacterium]|jgi:enoyl-[acyl-carrier protein] reductase I|nr:SDR family oxidoreductase [Puniceicoccales bacterium]